MQKKTLATLFLLIFLVSCASPALPPTATATVQPTLPATQTPSPTETTTPTPTEFVTATNTEQVTTPEIEVARGYFVEVGIPTDGIQFKMEGTSVVGVDSTGKEIYRDGFDIHWLVPGNLDPENLERSSDKPLNMPTRVDAPRLTDLTLKIGKEPKLLEIYPEKNYGLGGLLLHIFDVNGESSYAWGKVIFDKIGGVGLHLAYYDTNGVFHLIPIQPISGTEMNFDEHPELYK